MSAADASAERLARMSKSAFDATPQKDRSKMTATIVPFPISRRRKYILRQANRALEFKVGARERHIELQIKVQGDAMRRKGIEETLIARELWCMGAAIRSLLLRSSSGGAL